MTVRIIVFILIAIVAYKLAFNGELPRNAAIHQIGIQAVRNVFGLL